METGERERGGKKMNWKRGGKKKKKRVRANMKCMKTVCEK